jgi:hypothetical protein
VDARNSWLSVVANFLLVFTKSRRTQPTQETGRYRPTSALPTVLPALGGVVEQSAHGKLKASTGIRAPDVVEREGRWMALTVDEPQAIVENLQDIVENMRGIVENSEERDARHLWGHRGEIQTRQGGLHLRRQCPPLDAQNLHRIDASWIILQRNVGPIEGHRAAPRSAAGSYIENIPDPTSPSNALDAGRTPSKIQAYCCMLRVASRSPRICYPVNS